LPFLVSSVLKARGNFAEAVRRMLSEYRRGTLYLRVGRKPVVISADPRFARRVLVEHASHFPKTGWEKRVLKPTMEDGLIILEGKAWKEHRAGVAPCFSASLMEDLGNTVADATRSRLTSWQGKVAVGHEMRCITNDVLTRFFLHDHRISDGGNGSLDRYAQTFARLEQGLEDRVFDPLALIDRLRASARGQPRFSDALAWISRIIEQQVSRASEQPPPRKTALDLMLDRLPEKVVCREIRTLTAAGATTVHLLTWLCHLLATHPEIQSRLRREIGSSLEQHGDLVAALERCSYLEAVINEGLRLYPPAPYLLRQASPTIATQSDPDLPAPYSLVLISIWAMHRHPDFWEFPEQFIPERWLGGGEPPEAFVPFGMGPRVCIGRRFALIEAMIILSQIIQRFEIRPTPGKPIRPKLTVLTRPDREVIMSVEPFRPPLYRNSTGEGLLARVERTRGLKALLHPDTSHKPNSTAP
jgi:cytochrome P450